MQSWSPCSGLARNRRNAKSKLPSIQALPNELVRGSALAARAANSAAPREAQKEAAPAMTPSTAVAAAAAAAALPPSDAGAACVVPAVLGAAAGRSGAWSSCPKSAAMRTFKPAACATATHFETRRSAFVYSRRRRLRRGRRPSRRQVGLVGAAAVTRPAQKGGRRRATACATRSCSATASGRCCACPALAPSLCPRTLSTLLLLCHQAVHGLGSVPMCRRASSVA